VCLIDVVIRQIAIDAALDESGATHSMQLRGHCRLEIVHRKLGPLAVSGIEIWEFAERQACRDSRNPVSGPAPAHTWRVGCQPQPSHMPGGRNGGPRFALGGEAGTEEIRGNQRVGRNRLRGFRQSWTGPAVQDVVPHSRSRGDGNGVVRPPCFCGISLQNKMLDDNGKQALQSRAICEAIFP